MSSRTSDRSRTAPRWPLFLGLGLLPWASACISMDVPEPFLLIERSLSELKAVSPEEGLIWVREFSDSHKGDLDFWTEVLKEDLVTNRGYTLLEEGSTRDGADHEGTALHLETAVEGAARTYLLAVFVREGWLSNTISTVEYVDRKEQAEAHLEAVRKAIGTLRP